MTIISKFGKPVFACSKCGRAMELVTYLGEDMDKVMVECPICGIREVKTVTSETPRQV